MKLNPFFENGIVLYVNLNSFYCSMLCAKIDQTGSVVLYKTIFKSHEGFITMSPLSLLEKGNALHLHEFEPSTKECFDSGEEFFKS